MKKLLTMIVSLALLALAACGSHLLSDSNDMWVEDTQIDEDAQTDDVAQTDDARVEFGQVEQALIVMPQGFGWMPGSDGNRCWPPSGWPADCYVPFTKKLNYILDKGSCTGTDAQVFKDAIDLAYERLRADLQTRGWTVAKGLTNPANHGYLGISMACGSPFSGASSQAIGGTQLSESTSSCSSTSAGDLCQFGVANTRVYKSRILSFTGSNWTNATATQKLNFATNVIQHEMGGHSVGLGHDLCGASPLTKLMGPNSCMSGSQPSTWVRQPYTQIELDWLRDYQPF